MSSVQVSDFAPQQSPTSETTLDFDALLQQTVSQREAPDVAPAYPAHVREALVTALLEQSAVQDLKPPPGANDRDRRHHLAQSSTATYELFRDRYCAWCSSIEAFLVANTEYRQDRFSVVVTDQTRTRSGALSLTPDEARAINFAEQARQATAEMAPQLIEELAFPSFESLAGTPWLTHERLCNNSLDQLYAGAPTAVAAMAERLVDAFLETLGRANELFGRIEVGPESAKYSFFTPVVTDKLEAENIFDTGLTVTAQTRGARVTSRLRREHHLLDQEVYGLEATLANPALQLPPRYRALLQDFPHELRPHMASVFGTQLVEATDQREIHSRELQYSAVVARYLACEPCILFAGQTVLCGWGIELMTETNQLYTAHEKIVEQEKTHLLNAARGEGSFRTTFALAGGLLAMLTTELALALVAGSLAATLPLLPLFALAGASLYYALAATYPKLQRSQTKAKRVRSEGIESLKKKYPAFDENDPYLRDIPRTEVPRSQSS